MKRLIICCDGTWQDSDGGVKEDPTNITRICRALLSRSEDGINQIVYYQSGVGTGGTFDKLIGGGTGNGLSENVREAYGFIAHNYHPGDTIHLFGFSRGAYTARSICGLICRLGILTKKGMDNFYEVYEMYRTQKLRESPEYIQELQARDNGSLVFKDVVVTTIGCFDTVGSLGIPELPIPFLGRAISGVSNKDYRFHDTDLSPRVLHAFHALALDELRSPFVPTMWYKAPDNTVTELRQCWFPGVHTNIGGGYPDQEISDMTLAWMVERTKHFLAWDLGYLHHICKNDGIRKQWAEGEIYNSKTGVMRLAGTAVRTPAKYVPSIPNSETGECVHASVRVRKQLVETWAGGAMSNWKWRDDEHVWVGPDGEQLREDWLGDVEMELAGKEVVTQLLGFKFTPEAKKTK